MRIMKINLSKCLIFFHYHCILSLSMILFPIMSLIMQIIPRLVFLLFSLFRSSIRKFSYVDEVEELSAQ